MYFGFFLVLLIALASFLQGGAIRTLRWSNEDSIKAGEKSHDGNGTLLFFVQVGEICNVKQNYEMNDNHEHQ
jgi:hypothetical protein